MLFENYSCSRAWMKLKNTKSRTLKYGLLGGWLDNSIWTQLWRISCTIALSAAVVCGLALYCWIMQHLDPTGHLYLIYGINLSTNIFVIFSRLMMVMCFVYILPAGWFLMFIFYLSLKVKSQILIFPSNRWLVWLYHIGRATSHTNMNLEFYRWLLHVGWGGSSLGTR